MFNDITMFNFRFRAIRTISELLKGSGKLVMCASVASLAAWSNPETEKNDDSWMPWQNPKIGFGTIAFCGAILFELGVGLNFLLVDVDLKRAVTEAAPAVMAQTGSIIMYKQLSYVPPIIESLSSSISELPIPSYMKLNAANLFFYLDGGFKMLYSIMGISDTTTQMSRAAKLCNWGKTATGLTFLTLVAVNFGSAWVPGYAPSKEMLVFVAQMGMCGQIAEGTISALETFMNCRSFDVRTKDPIEAANPRNLDGALEGGLGRRWGRFSRQFFGCHNPDFALRNQEEVRLLEEGLINAVRGVNP